MSFSLNNEDEILGVWLNGSGKGHIQIYKQGKEFFGKIVWLKEPNDENGKPKLDSKNPDKAKQQLPILGALILRNFKYEDGEWSGGKIYDPENGKEYKCYMKLKDKNTLHVRGYIGISLIGRTDVWKRIK